MKKRYVMIVPEGLRVGGKKATEVVPLPPEDECRGLASALKFRRMKPDEFIDGGFSSGTVRKNRDLGMNVRSHVLQEMVAFVFGYHFEMAPERMVNWGEAVSMGDCKPITEVGWHVLQYASIRLFPGDEIELKYIEVERPGESSRSGVGIIFRKTSVQWVPQGHCVFCIIAEVDPKTHEYLPAVVP